MKLNKHVCGLARKGHGNAVLVVTIIWKKKLFQAISINN